MVSTGIESSTTVSKATHGTMNAIVRHVYGSVDVVRLAEIGKPQFGDDELLVRVQAAGVDRGVWHLMTGQPYALRLAGFGVRAPKNPVLGRELAGVVHAVGKNVTRFKPGDAVFGIGEGTFAEYARAREDKLALKPANVSFEQAAAASISATTALQALRDHGHVQPGQNILIIGASGGVGTFAVQLAKVFGAEVTGVCSTGKVKLVRSLGADHVMDYTREDFAASARRYDLILDIGGNSRVSRLRRALTAKGTLVIIGGEGGGRWLGVRRQLWALMLSGFVGQKMGTFIARENYKDLIVLQELIESGKLRSAIDRTYRLAEAADAILRLEEGRAQGKLVITV